MWLPCSTRELKDHLVPTPCCGQPRDQALGQVAQGAIQPGLDPPQGWGMHSVSGQPVEAPHRLQSEKLPLDVFIFLTCVCEAVSLHSSAYNRRLVEKRASGT